MYVTIYRQCKNVKIDLNFSELIKLRITAFEEKNLDKMRNFMRLLTKFYNEYEKFVNCITFFKY